MNVLLRLLALCTLALPLLTAPARAQGAGLGNGTGFGADKIIFKLLEPVKGFSADLRIQIRNTSGATLELPAKVDYAQQMARLDIDMSKAKGDQLPAEALEQIKAMGMSLMSSLTFLDKGQTLVIYPKLKAYAKLPAEDSTSAAQLAALSLKAEEQGQETIDGHVCVKRRYSGKLPTGKAVSLTAWCARDLKEFPLRMQFIENDSSVTMSYSELRLEPPLPARFALPSGYTEYPSIQEMIQGEMMKRLTP